MKIKHQEEEIYLLMNLIQIYQVKKFKQMNQAKMKNQKLNLLMKASFLGRNRKRKIFLI